MNNKVLITGITGQDGAYLARDLIEKGYQVFGAVRRGSTPKTERLRYLGLIDKINFIGLEITEFSNVLYTLSDLKPRYIYNLAAQSFVADSFQHPQLTTNVNYFGVLNILESMKISGIDCDLYQASTSEMYGEVLTDPQDELTPFNPMSPYAIAKCAAHYLIINYRKAYGMRASSGILFNHESELRGREFVTRKITTKLSEIKYGNSGALQLGNMSSVRDWGYAPDYVKGMQQICEAKTKDDYVMATNRVVSVRDFLSLASIGFGFDPVFDGEGLSEKCIDKKSGIVLAEVSKKYFRPSDVNYLRGDYKKIKKALGWQPTTTLEEMIYKMVSFDSDFYIGKGHKVVV
jgi:GDPmannose 4,6-dehydratase